MQEIESKSMDINIVSVVEALHEDLSKIGMDYLTELASSIPSTDPIKEYESIVYDQYRIREGQKLSSEYLNNPSEESLHNLSTRQG